MILDDIVRATRERLESLDTLPEIDPGAPPHRSLEAAIRACRERRAIIAEVKYASPSRGRIHDGCAP